LSAIRRNGNQKLETRNQKPETRSWKPETRNQNGIGSGNWKLETRTAALGDAPNHRCSSEKRLLSDAVLVSGFWFLVCSFWFLVCSFWFLVWPRVA
jgi:hypothetical protein